MATVQFLRCLVNYYEGGKLIYAEGNTYPADARLALLKGRGEAELVKPDPAEAKRKTAAERAAAEKAAAEKAAAERAAAEKAAADLAAAEDAAAEKAAAIKDLQDQILKAIDDGATSEQVDALQKDLDALQAPAGGGAKS